jgi:hypothetical protein
MSSVVMRANASHGIAEPACCRPPF